METDEEVNMYLNQLYSELKDNETSYKALFLRVVSSALKEGGAWDIFTSRTNTEYGYQIAISYFASSIKTRRLYSGVWSGWDTYVRTSDLEDLNSKTTLHRAFNTPFSSILKGKLNRVTYIDFHNPTDNPFSFNAGYAIAFQSTLLDYDNNFLLIGVDANNKSLEIKSFSAT